jgi:hypothetical protein
VQDLDSTARRVVETAALGGRDPTVPLHRVSRHVSTVFALLRITARVACMLMVHHVLLVMMVGQEIIA